MRFFERIRKKRAIESYIQRLPTTLANDYGRQPYYTHLQVQRSIERSGLNNHYQQYAMAMYTREPEFMAFRDHDRGDASYETLRAEVGNDYLSGSTDFNCSSIIAASASFSGGAMGDVGSFDSGDGGGGGADGGSGN
ncbi:DUF6559 family protein [Vreelandella sp. GE22]